MPCVKCKVKIVLDNQVRVSGGYKDFFDELTVSCGDCNQTHRRDKLSNHWLHHCKTLCPNQCGQTLSRTEQVSHPDICPMVKINCCHNGCKQTFLRKDTKELMDHTEQCYYGQLNKLSIEDIAKLAVQQLASKSAIGIVHNHDAKLDGGAPLEEKKESELIQGVLDQLTNLAQKYSPEPVKPTKQELKLVMNTVMMSVFSPEMIITKDVSFNKAVVELLKHLDGFFQFGNIPDSALVMKTVCNFVENNWNALYIETH